MLHIFNWQKVDGKYAFIGTDTDFLTNFNEAKAYIMFLAGELRLVSVDVPPRFK